MKKKHQFNTTWIQAERPLNFDDPNHDLKYKQESQNLPSKKSHIKYNCTTAWNSVTVDEKGRLFTCSCDGHVPFPVGTVNDFSSFDEIFSSEQAQLTQNSIKNREFEYCATQYCGIENRNQSRVPSSSYYLGINLDISCNLTCPSCRERMVFINDKSILDEKHKLGEQILLWVKNTDKIVNIELAGGDPFASLFYLDLIDKLSTCSNAKFIIRTNGLLLKSHSKRLDKIKDKISEFFISIDAGTKETYEIVRTPGRWENLLENLEFLKNNYQKRVSGGFVVQRTNIEDIIPFVDLCQQYNLIPRYWVIQDWGTMPDFEKECVHLPSNDMYQRFKTIVSDPKLQGKDISQLKQWTNQ